MLYTRYTHTKTGIYTQRLSYQVTFKRHLEFIQ